jgi:Skp family chaperone for outer membrane proteins
MFLKTKNFFAVLCLFLATSFSKGEKASNQLEKIEVSPANSVIATKTQKANAVKLDYESKNQIIFCVNRDEIFEKSKKAADIKKTMQEFEQQIISELKPMAEKFEEMRQDYEKKAKTLKRDALALEEEKISQLAQEVQMKQMESQDAYKREEMRLTKEFLSALSEACKEFLLRDENAHVVLFPIDNGMYIHNKYDATGKILEIMDMKFENSKKSTKLDTTKKNK